MSLSRKRTQRRATILGALIGSMIIFTFVISLIAPDLGSRSSSDVNDFPTLTPFGTLPRPTQVIIPTPEASPQFEGERPYIHSTGLFQTFRPSGPDWVTSEGQGVDNTASAVIQSPARLAVIHNYIRPGVQYETPEALSTDFLNEAHFDDAWAEYDNWQETGRAITNGRVTVNFDLMSNDNNYVGRAVGWVDDGWLYVIRMVAPANNAPLLDLLQSYVVPTFKSFPQLLSLPALWPAYVDQQLGYVLKHPETWTLIAGGTGRPVTFRVPSVDNITVRAWTVADRPLLSQPDAEAWLTETEPTASILAIEPVEHATAAGYQIAYTYRDAAGDPHSGLMVLLNGPGGTLYVASLQSERTNTNWLDAGSLSEADGEHAQALRNGFMVLLAESEQAVASPAPPDSTETPEVSPTPGE